MEILRRLIDELNTARGAFGMELRSWKVASSQCSTALRRLREPDWNGERLLDAVWATCWYDATQGPEGLRSGRHTNLPRVFKTGADGRGKLENWMLDWEAAGKPRRPAKEQPQRRKGGRPRGPSAKFTR